MMTDLHTLSQPLLLPLCFVGGLLLGIAYFTALRATANLIVAGGSPLLSLALSLGRFAFVTAGFYVAVLAGGLALVMAMIGFLITKHFMLRQPESETA